MKKPYADQAFFWKIVKYFTNAIDEEVVDVYMWLYICLYLSFLWFKLI